MIKIFLAEDEKIVREGIKNEIPWGKYGMQLVGEAADGELAYPLIQQTRPDILLTDIRMPFMDGLELSELVKKEMPDIRIIFFSGYDDFEYAKKAIRIGVSDYLLKPVSSEQLLTALEQMCRQIRQMRSDKEYVEQFKKELKEQRSWERERIFDDIISGCSLPELIRKAKSFGIDLMSAAYNVVLFQFQNPSEYPAVSLKINEAYKKIKELLKEYPYVIGFDRLSEGMAFIVKGEQEESLTRHTEHWIQLLNRLVNELQDLDYFGAVGIPVGRLSEVRESCRAAGKAFAYRYMTERSEWLTYDELIRRQNRESTDHVELKDLDISRLDKNVLEHFLKTSSLESGEYFIEDYIESFAGNLKSQLFRQYILMDVYMAVSRYAAQIGVLEEVAEEAFGGIGQVVQSSQSAAETEQSIKVLLRQALKFGENVSRKRYSQLLEQAKNYIHKNYQNENISLSAVASEVNLSASHFSAIFSQEMGITFVEYLTSVRMEQARHLLRYTDLRTSEIAYQVGYKDPHYFSYLFKKTQGITPKSCRGGME